MNKPLRPSDDYDKQDKEDNDVWDDQDIGEDDLDENNF